MQAQEQRHGELIIVVGLPCQPFQVKLTRTPSLIGLSPALQYEFPEGDEKDNLVALICNHMKKDYMAWNKDTVDDRKIADDLAELSDGKLQMTDNIVRLMATRLEMNYRSKNAGPGNRTNMPNNRNNNYKRKY